LYPQNYFIEIDFETAWMMGNIFVTNYYRFDFGTAWMMGNIFVTNYYRFDFGTAWMMGNIFVTVKIEICLFLIACFSGDEQNPMSPIIH